MKKSLIIATRPGKLAIAQTEFVIGELLSKYPDIQITLKIVETDGDFDHGTALWDLKGTGFFTTQIEDVLLRGEADLAVHSYKDLPTYDNELLMVAAVPFRAAANDCLVAKEGVTSLSELHAGAVVGTSSLRRAAQLLYLRPDLNVKPIRGNVPTRVAKVDDGQYDAAVLAAAGLDRIGFSNRISELFSIEQFLPAPAQGALGVQVQSYRFEIIELVKVLEDSKTRICVEAERQILVSTKSGCRTPVGAFAKIEKGDISIEAFAADPKGQTLIRKKICGPAEKAIALADELARMLLDAGAADILERFK